MTDDSPKNSPTVTVVALTYNRLPLLRLLLEAIEKQTVERGSFRMIVVDNGSTDGETSSFLQDYQHQHPDWFRCILLPVNQALSIARNKAVFVAETDLLAFTDDDCIPNVDWLQEFVAYMRNHNEVVAAGGLVYGKRDNLVGRFLDATRVLHPPPSSDGAVYLITANACFRRQAVIDVDGFDEALARPSGEDADLAIRVKDHSGKRLGICESAIVRHEHRDTVKGVAMTFFTYGKGAAYDQDRKWTMLRTVLVPLARNLKMALTDGTSFMEKLRFVPLGVLRVAAFNIGYFTQSRRLRHRKLSKRVDPTHANLL